VTPTYELGDNGIPTPFGRSYSLGPHTPWILCLVCGWKSHIESDVAQLYCRHCHEFHEVMMLQAEGAAANNPAVIALDLVKRGVLTWAAGGKIDLESFERAASYLGQPVVVLALPPWWLLGLGFVAAIAGLLLVFGGFSR